MEIPKLIDAAQLAAVMGVSLPTVRKWTQARAVPFVRIGRTIRFDLAAVLEARTVKPSKLKV